MKCNNKLLQQSFPNYYYCVNDLSSHDHVLFITCKLLYAYFSGAKVTKQLIVFFISMFWYDRSSTVLCTFLVLACVLCTAVGLGSCIYCLIKWLDCLQFYNLEVKYLQHLRATGLIKIKNLRNCKHKRDPG